MLSIFLLLFFSFSTNCLFRDFSVELRSGEKIDLRSEKSVELLERRLGKENVIRHFEKRSSSSTSSLKPSRKSTETEVISDLSYFTNEEMLSYVEIISNNYDFCSYEELGKSYQDREIISVTINVHEDEDEDDYPGVIYIANMHGDEKVGFVLMTKFIDYLCSNYGVDSEVTDILDHSILYIVPSMNPDGYANSQRETPSGVDLNRNFLDQFEGQITSMADETKMIVDLMTSKTNVVLDANFHGGTIVASYLYDGNTDSYGFGDEELVLEFQGHESISPDDDFSKYSAMIYAAENPEMLANSDFTDGVTNGAKWYPLYGGLQDYGYVFHDILSITVELSYDKTPPEADLDLYYNDNLQSILEYTKLAYSVGIKGTITSKHTNQTMENVNIEIEGIDKVMKSRKNGLYYRLLKPGKEYNVIVSKEGYVTMNQSFYLPETQSIQRVINFSMEKVPLNWGRIILGIFTVCVVSSLLLFVVCVFCILCVLISCQQRKKKSSKEVLYSKIPNQDIDERTLL